MRDLEGKVAVITGAGHGIGRETAVALASKGCRLAICDNNEAALEGVRHELEEAGATVTAHAVDVSDREQVARFASDVVEAHGEAHVLVNNAGVTVYASFEEHEIEDFEWIVGVNFWGVVYGTKAFLPLLKQRPEGHIVNISSINGMIPFPNNGPYNAAKFAVRGFNKTLIQELRGSPIHIMSVHPGGIKTNIVSNMRYYKHAHQDINHQELVDVFDRSARTTADKAAKIIISGIKKNKKRLLVGTDAGIMDMMVRMFPLGATRLTGILTERLMKK